MVVAGSGAGGGGAGVGPEVCPGGPDGFSPGGPPDLVLEQLEIVAVVAVVVVLTTVTVLV